MRVYAQIAEDNLWVIAAGVAFYALLSLFPGIAATIPSYGLVADVATIEGHLVAIGSVLPQDARELVVGEIRTLRSSSDAALRLGALMPSGSATWQTSNDARALDGDLTLTTDT